MNEVYRHGGVAHDIVGCSDNGGAFHWIDVRCGARLPPQLGPGNIGENEPVTCLFCLCADDPPPPDPMDEYYGDDDEDD